MKPLTLNDKILMPVTEIPNFRVGISMQNKTDKRWLIKTWGGLGDVVCAEPVLRFITRRMPDIEVHVQTSYPELFRHLRVTCFPESTPLDESKYYVAYTINHQDSLTWQFMSHGASHPVDYISLNLLRNQIPTADREIKLPTYTSKACPKLFADLVGSPEEFIIVHPGKHWPSKTFPAEWWSELVSLLSQHWSVILIGKTVDENVGFVPFSVDAEDAVYDLRDYPGFNLKDLIAFLTKAEYVFSNDSSPIHIAAAGGAHIGFVASCKHADFIKHWRGGKWSRRMYDFGRDNLYNHLNLSPVQGDSVEYGSITPEELERILPKPKDVLKGMLALRPRKPTAVSREHETQRFLNGYPYFNTK